MLSAETQTLGPAPCFSPVSLKRDVYLLVSEGSAHEDPLWLKLLVMLLFV